MQHRWNEEFVGDAQFGEVRLDVFVVEALEQPLDDRPAGTEPGRTVEWGEAFREHVSAQHRVDQQPGDEAGDAGGRAQPAVCVEVAAGTQLHPGDVAPLGGIVEVHHHHAAQQAVAEALFTRKATVRHRHQCVLVGQHVDGGEVGVAGIGGDVGLQGADRLDGQAGRAQDLQVVELEVLVCVADGVEDPFREAPDGPAGSFRAGHEAHVRLIHVEVGRLAEIMMHHDSVRRQGAGQLSHRFRAVDGRHHNKCDLGFHGGSRDLLKESSG